MRTKLATTAAVAFAAALAAGTASATYPGHNGRIAYPERAAGGFQIWTVLPDGSDPRQLTTEGDNAAPSFSRDGRLIAFTSENEIWTMNADGTGRRQVTHIGARAVYPAFSPNGARIVFAGHTSASPKDDLYVVAANGAGLKRLTHGAGNNDQPVLSPDGRRIAFVSDRTGVSEVWAMNADGSHQTQLTTDKATHFAADWSPNGKRLVYDDGNPGSPTAIYVMNADGSGKRQLTRGGTRDFGPRWSPDGRQIAFVRVFGFASNAEQDVFVMNADGSHQRALHKAGRQLVPAWQPLP